jgi:hypothetical protein
VRYRETCSVTRLSPTPLRLRSAHECGADPERGQYIDWRLLPATLSFDAGSVPPGTHVARVYFFDELVKRAESVTFTVAP